MYVVCLNLFGHLNNKLKSLLRFLGGSANEKVIIVTVFGSGDVSFARS